MIVQYKIAEDVSSFVQKNTHRSLTPSILTVEEPIILCVSFASTK